MPASPAARRCAVVGSPIAHSLSPVLHCAAYRHLGLPWEYTRAEVREGELAGFVAGLDATWRGLSVTMPLKREALALAGSASSSAVLAGAANTLLFEPDDAVRADNTDVGGMADSVRAVAMPGGGATSGGMRPDAEAERGRMDVEIRSACVWGGGSTAASAVVALDAMEVADVHLHARDTSRARPPLDAAIRAGVDIRVASWDVGAACAAADLVVLTAPAGAADGVAARLAAEAHPGRVLFDVVYDPWPTVAAEAWRRAGGRITSGLDLLVHQAVGQVRLMTGHDVPADVLYAALP